MVLPYTLTVQGSFFANEHEVFSPKRGALAAAGIQTAFVGTSGRVPGLLVGSGPGPGPTDGLKWATSGGCGNQDWRSLRGIRGERGMPTCHELFRTCHVFGYPVFPAVDFRAFMGQSPQGNP